MSNWEKTEGQKGLEQAEETDQYFWADTDGAHISSTGDHDTSGFHQLLTSVKNAFMHGTTELMTISADLIELGKNSASAVIKFCAGTGEIGVIDSMLTLFSDKVGVKGNSQAILASNGESNMAASKQNTTYTGLAQAASTAPSTDADPASALLKAKYTKNSDSSTVSEAYINLEAKPDGTALANIKASEINVLGAREPTGLDYPHDYPFDFMAPASGSKTIPYIAVKNDANTIYTVPFGCTIALTVRDSYGQPSDGGISFDGTNVSLGGINIVVNGETYPFSMLQNALSLESQINHQSGVVSATSTGAWLPEVTVQFATPFSGIPIVVLNQNSNEGSENYRITDVTSTHFKVANCAGAGWTWTATWNAFLL